MNVYDAIYGGPGIAMADTTPVSATTTTTATAWSPDPFDLSNFNLGDFGHGVATAQSVLSLSEDSLSSHDDLGPSELNGIPMDGMGYRGTMMPVTSGCGVNEGYVLDGLGGFI